jgi:hypothetical protein
MLAACPCAAWFFADVLMENSMHQFQRYPSTYGAFVVWGVAGFMGQPTIASFVVHFFILPVALLTILWLAHREGRHQATKR